MGELRGRRPDTAGPAAAGHSSEAVIAWLLRVNRLYGSDESLAVAARFARVYGSASESQISRWERATLRLSPAVISRYEEVLGLAEGRLAAVAHTLYRESLGRLGPPALRASAAGQPARDRLGQLLERALGAHEMAGRDWDELTAGLWQVPVLLHPASLWHELAERLLGELLVAEGVGWLWRCEAINRLLGLGDATAAVVEACVTVLGDPRSQVLIEPAALLEMTPHPVAAKQLLAQIDDPASPHALRAAWWSVAEKAGRGHFLPEQVQRLALAALETLRDNGSPLAARVAAAETIRQLLPEVSPATRRALSRAAHADLVTAHVMRTGTTCPVETVQAVAFRLAHAALSMMRQEILRQDPMLERLVAEMLFHPQGTRRTVAAQTIAATPYRPALATAIGRELARNATVADAALATALVQALGHLGGPGEASLVWRLALGQAMPAPVSEAAAWVAGHLHTTDSGPWKQARARLLRERDGPLACHTKGLMYSLGAADRRADLAALAAAPRLHPDLRTATSWWLAIPAPLRRSASQ